MDKTLGKKLLKTYEKKLTVAIKEKECKEMEIEGLVKIVDKLTKDLAELEQDDND